MKKNIYFDKEELKLIHDAIEDHRASSKEEPRSIYGKIVSSADRNNKVEDCLRRTYTYGKKLNPNATDEDVIDVCKKCGIHDFIIKLDIFLKY